MYLYLQLNGCEWRARHSRTFLNSGLAVEGKCCTKLLTRFKTLLWHRPLWIKLLCILSRDFAEFPADNQGTPGGRRGGFGQTSRVGQMHGHANEINALPASFSSTYLAIPFFFCCSFFFLLTLFFLFECQGVQINFLGTLLLASGISPFLWQ